MSTDEEPAIQVLISMSQRIRALLLEADLLFLGNVPPDDPRWDTLLEHKRELLEELRARTQRASEAASTQYWTDTGSGPGWPN